MAKPKLDKESKIVLLIILGYVVLLSILAYFRFAIYDEKLYLHETAMMSQILARGEWIGRYGVGVHGFLFKLPVALAYLITGPSIYVATFFHILLSGASAWIFYLIIKRFIKDKWIIILTLFLLLTNFSYVSWSTTYLREIPVLFATLLFLYIYTFKDFKYKTIISGLCLMLVLDAKEYVFFMLLPAISIHILIIEYSKNKNIIKTILFSAKKIILLLTPSLIYLYLMFYTNLLPINMFNASLLGLTGNGLSYQINHTIPENALADMQLYYNNNVIYNHFLAGNAGTITPIFFVLASIFAYIEKFFYISNFSFQSITLIILIPSIITSVHAFKIWKNKSIKLLFLPLSYWVFIFIFIIRSSHQRYLFPIIPISIFFFVLFLIYTFEEQEKFKNYYKTAIILLTISTIISFFYQDLTDLKVVLNITTLAGFTGFFIFLYYTKKYKKIATYFIIFSIIITSLLITSYALFSKNQIYKSLTWGINGEADKIAELLETEDVILIDCGDGDPGSNFAYLINFYRTDTPLLPIEWNWRLDKNKIRRDLEREESVESLHPFPDNLNTTEALKIKVQDFNINKIILFKSNLAGKFFPQEDKIPFLLEQDWLELHSIKEMKNKNVYIFKIL